jgi:PAS domain S-box-containing protein
MKKMTPLKIIIIYLVSSQLWVILTDLLLAKIATSPDMFAKISIMKGGLYFIVTGSLLYWLISRYASERDLAEKSLRISEQSYKTLSENLPGIVYRVFSRENNRMKFFNKASIEITGYSDSELSRGVVCSLESLIHIEDRPNVLAAVENAIGAHKSFTVEYRLQHRNGSFRFLLEKGTPVYTDDGKLLSIDGVIFDITERKRFEAALTQSEERFRAFMDNSPSIAWMKDDQGRYIYLSRTFERRFDVRLDDVRGNTDYEIWPQEFAEVFRKNDLKVLNDNQPIEIAEETAGLNGKRCFWMSFKFPFQDAAGQRYVGGMAVDITERIQAENELKRIQSNITAIIECTNDMIWSVDLNYGLVTFNSAFEKHLLRTYGKNVFIGATPEDILPADRAKIWLASYARALREGPYRMEYVLVDGPILEISFNLIVQDLKTVGISAFAKDITERKQIETALRDSEEQFRRAVIAAPFPVMIHAEDGEILAVSDVLTELTGYAYEDIRTLSMWTERVYGQKSQEINDFIKKLFDLNSKNEGSEYDIITRSGKTLTWFFRSSPLGKLRDGRKLRISMAIDITERKRMEEERIERRSAERAMNNVLMEIHDGIGGITTNITMLSEVAKKATKPEDAEKALNTISDLARDGMVEIRSLMYSLDREDLNWRSFVVEMRNQGTKFLEPHAITFNMISDIEDNIRNPGSHLCLNLFRIYREALMNVIKHAKASKVMVSFHVDKEHLVLTIQDDGKGFEQSALMGSGRGIGNMIARATTMHGKVAITGDRGTCVTIEMPVELKAISGQLGTAV